jgi:hypothetical protein
VGRLERPRTRRGRSSYIHNVTAIDKARGRSIGLRWQSQQTQLRPHTQHTMMRCRVFDDPTWQGPTLVGRLELPRTRRGRSSFIHNVTAIHNARGLSRSFRCKSQQPELGPHSQHIMLRHRVFDDPTWRKLALVGRLERPGTRHGRSSCICTGTYTHRAQGVPDGFTRQSQQTELRPRSQHTRLRRRVCDDTTWQGLTIVGRLELPRTRRGRSSYIHNITAIYKARGSSQGFTWQGQQTELRPHSQHTMMRCRVFDDPIWQGPTLVGRLELPRTRRGRSRFIHNVTAIDKARGRSRSFRWQSQQPELRPHSQHIYNTPGFLAESLMTSPDRG